MTTPEAKVKTEIRKYLSAQAIFWVSVQNGPGAKPGDPDLVLCYRGRFIGVEVKSATGKLRPLQKVRQKEIEASGGEFWIVRTLDDLKLLLSL